MVFTHDELDRMADEDLKDRVIRRSMYCGACGYNLRGLPHIHVCPECGNSYNARSRRRFGIFEPQQAEFPGPEIAGFLIFAVVTTVITWQGVVDKSKSYCLAGIGFGIVAILFLGRVWRRMSKLANAKLIALRIAEQEENQT